MRATPITIDVLLTPDRRRAALLEDVRRGLTATPKAISPVWFYDDRGSRLFDEITRLPEYDLTRAERALLGDHAREIASVTAATSLVELGSGTSDKTRVLLDALIDAGTLLSYVPLDVSEETLLVAAADIAAEYPGIDVHAVVGDFHQHLHQLVGVHARLIAFLGSTIGNLDPTERAAFLRELRASARPQDHLLLGVDLVKDPARHIAAYDDARGVTAEFNRNALHVLNRDLDGDFDPSVFDHRAVWIPDQRWIEMRLRSRIEHTVRLEALGLTVHFARGEELRTEISAKFTPTGMTAELHTAGFAIDRTWTTDGYALILARPD